ncbi:hypothetical protein [Caulobacter sp. BE254]|uniref:hypothetical protein n=1 Tax=Caulobacter sp. BE254 TaxID=2817720 RepID=UPI0028667E95|nr:hypothetical protein [Caulobacter sp. BE254]MDR7115819.1 hypothetical protein [Caulobacter sp. BE254]
MGRKRKSGRRGTQPDEMFSAGPFEFARFGRLVLGRNNMTVADHAKVQEKMAARFPAVTLEIQILVDRISNRVAGLPPAKLLQRAWWGFATRQMMDIEGSGTGANATEDDATALRLVDYVQSVIAATPPRLPYAEEVNDDDWAALSSDVGKLFRFLVHEYPVTRTAFRRKEDPNLDMELEAFQVRAELLWVNVRGHRYQTQERQALAEVVMNLDLCGLAHV